MTYLTSADGVHWTSPSWGAGARRRRDHNVVFTSDTVPGKGSGGPRGKKRFITPSTPMTPQGKKSVLWSVVRHPHPRTRRDVPRLAIVQDHRRGRTW